jgi:hypothetical protein
LLDVASDAELTGDHAKGRDIVLRMAEYRHVPIEIRDLTDLLHERQLVGDSGRAVGKMGR